MKKIAALIIFFTCNNIFAFNWPQTQIIQSDQFYSYFGQLRGNTISNSLIFSDPSEVKAADDGKISIVISDFEDYTDFFPSTLGNAVIISHNDNLLTVYGNIDQNIESYDVWDCKEVKTGTILGMSGITAWQQGLSSLEFHVIDTKNNAAINPRILMPRVGKELPLYYGDVTLKSKSGKSFNAKTPNIVPSGIYKIYKNRQAVAVPYKTRVSINGTVVDQISYDILNQNENQIVASGKKSYPKNILYPDNDLQLLGEATLTPGKNLLQLNLVDILGKETPASYLITVY